MDTDLWNLFLLSTAPAPPGSVIDPRNSEGGVGRSESGLASGLSLSTSDCRILSAEHLESG